MQRGQRIIRITVFGVILFILNLTIQWTTMAHAGSALSQDYWRNIVVHPSIPTSSKEMNLHNDSTVLSVFSSKEIIQLNDIVTSFLLSPTSHMWSKIDRISKNSPFVFYHQRKAGGTSVRITLYVSALNSHLSSFIPCFNNVSCDTYVVPAFPAYAIYSGHLKWGTLDTVARVNADIRHKYSCATNYRHPYSRIESCLYFRFGYYFSRRNISCLHDLPLSEFRDLLFKLDAYGNSCLNEPFRVLSGISDEYLLDHLTDSLTLASSKQRKLRAEEDVLHTILKLTLQHTQKCPPLVLEIPASYDLMTNRAQFFQEYDSFTAGTVSNVLDKVSCVKLHGDHLQLVKQFASLEMILYDAVFRKTIQHAYEELPSSFILDMVCYDHFNKRISPVNNALNNTSLTLPIVIVADETFEKAVFMGQIVEFATGEITGGNSQMMDLSSYLKEFSECKQDYATIFMPVTSVSLGHATSSSNNLFFRIEKGEKCHKHKLRDFGNAVFVWKDPFVEYFLLVKELSLASATSQQIVDGLDNYLSNLTVPLNNIQNEEELVKRLHNRYFGMYMSEDMFRLLYAQSLVSRLRLVSATKLTRALFDELLQQPGQSGVWWPRFATRQVLHVSMEALLLSAQHLYQAWIVRHSLYNAKNNVLEWRAAAPPFSTLLSPPYGSYFSHVPYLASSQDSVTLSPALSHIAAVAGDTSTTFVAPQKRRKLTTPTHTSVKRFFPTNVPSSHVLLSLLAFINSKTHQKGLLYPSTVDDDHRKSTVLQRIGCVFPNILKTKPTRDRLRLNEDVLSFYKTHPMVLKYVSKEVSHVMSRLQIASESVLFTFVFDRH